MSEDDSEVDTSDVEYVREESAAAVTIQPVQKIVAPIVVVPPVIAPVIVPVVGPVVLAPVQPILPLVLPAVIQPTEPVALLPPPQRRVPKRKATSHVEEGPGSRPRSARRSAEMAYMPLTTNLINMIDTYVLIVEKLVLDPLTAVDVPLTSSITEL